MLRGCLKSLEINFAAKSSNPLKRVESHTESSKDDFSFKPELQFRATIIFLAEQYWEIPNITRKKL